MKKRILCVILSLAAVFSLFCFNATEAWFSSGKNKRMELNSGGLDFIVDGLSFQGGNNFLPGDSISDANITITNESTIDTELRIKLEYNHEVKDEDGNIVDMSLLTFNTDTKWEEVTGEDGCTYIYYRPATVSNDPRRITPPPRTVNEQTGEVTFSNNVITLSSGFSINEDVPVEFNNHIVNITIVFQAKQADFMKWEDFSNPYGMSITVGS